MANEKRLIDAMPLVTKISRRVRGMSIPQDIYDGVLECIAEAPTVDAVEVVHGRWIPINTIDKWRFQCDQCKHYIDAGLDRNYCGNCGAKMDGGNEDG